MSARAVLCSFIHGSHDSPAVGPAALSFLGGAAVFEPTLNTMLIPSQIMSHVWSNHCHQRVFLSLSCSVLLLLLLFSGFHQTRVGLPTMCTCDLHDAICFCWRVFFFFMFVGRSRVPLSFHISIWYQKKPKGSHIQKDHRCSFATEDRLLLVHHHLVASGDTSQRCSGEKQKNIS